MVCSQIREESNGALLKKTKKLPGWAGVFAERDTDGETNEFSHSRVGNLLCEDTEGFRALLLMRRNHQCLHEAKECSGVHSGVDD